jgi:enoyl-[acyl-carrier protein] reductase III
MSFFGKTALITHGARGIGRGISLKLAEMGARVAVHYHQDELSASNTLARLRACGSDGFIIQADVSQPNDIRHLFRTVEAEFEKLDIFVSNSRPQATTFFYPTMEITLEQWDMAVNLPVRAFLLAGQEAARLMSDQGRVLAITYVAGGRARNLQPWGRMGVAKEALESLVRYFAVDLAKRGITVNAISHGWLEGSMLDSLPPEAQNLIRSWHAAGWTPMGRLGTPGDIGKVVALLCSEDAGWITGQVIYADGGASLMNSEIPPEIQLST